MNQDEMETDLRAAVDERLGQRREAARRRREKRETDRAAKNARRTAGLRQRHRRILARRNDQNDETAPSPTGRDHDPQNQSPTEHTESLRASSEGGTYEQAANRPTVFGASSEGGTENEPVQRDEMASLPRTTGQPQDDETTATALGRGLARTGTAMPTRARVRARGDQTR